MIIFCASVAVSEVDICWTRQVGNIIVDNSDIFLCPNPIALKKAKIVYNFGLSECNRVNSQTRGC